MSSVKLANIPAGATYLDVDSIPVVKLPDGDCIAFDFAGASRPYPNHRKADLEGDKMSGADFREWVTSGRNRFDRA